MPANERVTYTNDIYAGDRVSGRQRRDQLIINCAANPSRELDAHYIYSNSPMIGRKRWHIIKIRLPIQKTIQALGMHYVNRIFIWFHLIRTCGSLQRHIVL